jgi:alcohol dehydrogenase class IV
MVPRHAQSDDDKVRVSEYSLTAQQIWFGAAGVIPVNFRDWPGQIIFGAGAVSGLSEIVGRLSQGRAMVVCGASVARNGLLSKVKTGLGDKLAVVFAEATSHTPIEMVKRGVDCFRDSGAEVLVTVGGGSTIDAGKSIALMLASDGDPTRYAIRYNLDGEMDRLPLPRRTVPHVAVPTTAGSASDVMPTASCRDPASGRKILFWDDDLTPSVSVLDPEMATQTPPFLTSASGMTAMARAVEALYSGRRHPVSTGLALHAVRLLREGLPRSVEAPADIEARAACQMAAAMSGIAAINAMVSVVHAVGHVVGGRYALQHGISHAILLAPAMRRLLPAIGSEQTLLLEALGGQSSGTPDQDGAEAGDRISALVAALPLPHRLRDVGIAESELAEIAHLSMTDYMVANLPRPMPEAEVLALLTSVW